MFIVGDRPHRGNDRFDNINCRETLGCCPLFYITSGQFKFQQQRDRLKLNPLVVHTGDKHGNFTRNLAH